MKPLQNDYFLQYLGVLIFFRAVFLIEQLLGGSGVVFRMFLTH